MDASIIVPAYNCKESIERCINSLVQQTTEYNYEILIVDDNSSDGTASIIDRLKRSYPDRIRTQHNHTNKGQGPSKDDTLSLTTGKYILYVDSDDFVEPDYVQTMLEAIMGYDSDVLISNYFKTTNEKDRLVRSNQSPWTLFHFSAGWGKAFNAGFIKANSIEYGNFRYGEDTHFSLMSFINEAKIAFIDYAGYHYCNNANSISRERAYDKNLEIEISRVYDSIIRSSKFSKLSRDAKQMIEYSYITDMLSTLIVQNGGCGKDRMSKKTDYFIEDLNEKFPRFGDNKYIGLFRPKGQKLKIRMTVFLFRLSCQLGVSKAFINFFA